MMNWFMTIRTFEIRKEVLVILMLFWIWIICKNRKH